MQFIRIKHFLGLAIQVIGIALPVILFSGGESLAAESKANIEQNTESPAYSGAPIKYESKPDTFDFFFNFIDDLPIFIDRIDPVENAWPLFWIATSTLLLVEYDQEILDSSKRFSQELGLISDEVTGREGETVIDFSYIGLDLPVRIPSNLNSMMYFIGDGITHISIVAGLSIYGNNNNDFRANNTASQIMESILVTGTVVQILKRTTGRESPYRRTEDGGRWDLFPNQADYSENVSRYDAFPSGHLATAMATTTVLAANYPEKTWIKPTGYTLMGLLGFSMLNNEVHWASDYPLGIAIGWLSADIAIERGMKRRKIAQHRSKDNNAQVDFFMPYLYGEDGIGLMFASSF